MQCRNCGIEIADKAIVCYRCGTSTTDPVRKPVQVTPKRSPLFSLVLLVALAVVALYLGRAATTAANPDMYKLAAGVCAGAALVVLLVRVLRRR